MQKIWEIVRAGLDSVLLYPWRGLLTVLCLVAILAPLLVGLGIASGIRREAALAIDAGADLYVTGTRFGRFAPLPLATLEALRALDGVQAVRPRIVGRVVLGKERVQAVLVGVDRAELADELQCVRGRWFEAEGAPEFVIGTELARRLGLDVGARIPPFYRSSRGDRVSTVVGVFESRVSLWQANLIVTSFDAAADIFDQPDLATEILVTCRTGYESSVAAAVTHWNLSEQRDTANGITFRVMTKDEAAALLPVGINRVDGLFSLHLALACALGIPVVLVVSGAGHRERRQEIGMLKALGWQTDEVLLRGLAESFILVALGVTSAVTVAWVWLRVFNGVGIAGFFLAGVGAAPTFQVPFVLAPLPVFLASVLGATMVLTGTLASAWRAATVAPREALR